MRSIHALLAAFVLLAGPGVVQGQEAPFFEDVALDDLLDWAATAGDEALDFIYEHEIRQVRIHVLRQRPVEPGEVLGFLRLVLKFNRFLLVESGGTYQVIRDTQGRWQPGPIVDREELAAIGDAEIVTVAVPLRHANAKELQALLNLARLSHPNIGTVVGLASSGVLLVTDYAGVVRKLVGIVDLLDVPDQASNRLLSFSIYLFDGVPLEDAPAASHGDQARRVAARVRAEEGSLIAGRFGQFAQPRRDTRRRFEFTGDGARLQIGLAVEAEGEGGQGSILLPPTQVEVSVGIEVADQADRSMQLNYTLGLPLASVDTFASIQTLRRSDRSVTLVVIVEMQE